MGFTTKKRTKKVSFPFIGKICLIRRFTTRFSIGQKMFVSLHGYSVNLTPKLLLVQWVIASVFLLNVFFL